MMEEINDNTPMSFGQYKNQPLVSVPASYLLWLYDNDRAGKFKQYIKDNMDLLHKEAAKESKRKRGGNW